MTTFSMASIGTHTLVGASLGAIGFLFFGGVEAVKGLVAGGYVGFSGVCGFLSG